MNKEIKAIEPKAQLSINRWDFITGMFILTTIMFFASQTSAYLVRRAEGNWTSFELPTIFWYSTGVLVLSSIFMQLSYFSAKKDNFYALKLYISITFALGLVFLFMQWNGWVALVDQKVFFVGNPAGSFMYVFTGLISIFGNLFNGLGGKQEPWVESLHKLGYGNVDGDAIKPLFEFLQFCLKQVVADNELGGLLTALNGQYLAPGPGGDPIRNPDVLPTGKNIHALDPQSIPTTAAVSAAKEIGRAHV